MNSDTISMTAVSPENGTGVSKVGKLSDFMDLEDDQIFRKLRQIECFSGVNEEYVNLLEERIDTIRDRVEAAVAITKKLATLVDEPKNEIEKIGGENFWKTDPTKPAKEKSKETLALEKANVLNRQFYYSLYVIVMFQKLGEECSYYITFDEFRKTHEATEFEIRRGKKMKDGKTGTVKGNIGMDFTDSEWRSLWHIRNIIIICFLVSPLKLNQKSLFVAVAGILGNSYRPPQGGRPSAFTTALNQVVYPSVVKIMFPTANLSQSTSSSTGSSSSKTSPPADTNGNSAVLTHVGQGKPRSDVLVESVVEMVASANSQRDNVGNSFITSADWMDINDLPHTEGFSNRGLDNPDIFLDISEDDLCEYTSEEGEEDSPGNSAKRQRTSVLDGDTPSFCGY